MADKDINEWMAFFAKGAEEFALFLDFPALDYSVNSIEQIEEICAIVYDEKPKSFLSKLLKGSAYKKDIITTSKLLDSYIGQVMIRHHGGKWSFENIMNEGNTIVLTINDMKTFPVAKVHKRLKNGAEDNVYHYYQLITRELPSI